MILKQVFVLGIAYITFAKTSEACLAQEETDGKSIPNRGYRKLKVCASTVFCHGIQFISKLCILKVNFSTNARDEYKASDVLMNVLCVRVEANQTKDSLEAYFKVINIEFDMFIILDFLFFVFLIL